MMDTNKESQINWRIVYATVVGWLVLLIIMMRIFTVWYTHGPN